MSNAIHTGDRSIVHCREGTFAVVMKCKSLETGEACAMKRMKVSCAPPPRARELNPPPGVWGVLRAWSLCAGCWGFTVFTVDVSQNLFGTIDEVNRFREVQALRRLGMVSRICI